MVSALPCAIKQNLEKEFYKIYITDALKTVSENTARLGEGCTCINRRFYDVLHPVKEDARTGDEIVEDVTKRAGIEVIIDESV